MSLSRHMINSIRSDACGRLVIVGNLSNLRISTDILPLPGLAVVVALKPLGRTSGPTLKQ